MTHEEQLKFVQCMKEVYRGKSERLERQFDVTFNIACDLLRALDSLYADGSNHRDLAAVAERKRDELRAVIDMPRT